MGEVKAVKAARLRVPEGTPEEHAQLAEEAKDQIVAVMRGEVGFKSAPHVLKAATTLRQEICGPVPQKLEHTGENGGPLVVHVVKYAEDK